EILAEDVADAVDVAGHERGGRAGEGDISAVVADAGGAGGEVRAAAGAGRAGRAHERHRRDDRHRIRRRRLVDVDVGVVEINVLARPGRQAREIRRRADEGDELAGRADRGALGRRVAADAGRWDFADEG